MVLLSLVASHSDVDLETVARLSAGSSQVAAGVLEEGKAVSGAVVLSTCNRLEIYCEAESEAHLERARAEVVAAISGATGLPEPLVSRYFDTKTGADVTRHLFAVGAGLDSAVVGEREIAGQVRRALIQAQDQGTASAALVRLFQAASRTAKDVGARTALGGRGLSIVSVALDLATDLSEDRRWAAKNVVVFGTGAYAGATMALLRERGCANISVYSPSGRAATFTATRGGTPLTGETLGAALAAADVVIGCSGSDSRVGADEVEQLRAGSGKPLIMIDLALTHDFDPAVAGLDGVELITLESVRLAAPEEQAESVRQAEEIVVQAARAFEDQQQERSIDSAIVALRRHTMQVLEKELEKVRNQHGCTGPAQEVEFAMRRMVKQLLHLPTVRARELAAAGRQDDYIAALDALYGIAVEPPAEETASRAQDGCPVPHDASVAESA
ncbi:glutamyl-tRNA reductase [Arthrobacter mobilis]|uniref:Glutamyl-tRNA reductase n=1 Tax=Arthrobacter mobilis TaxID=2724944 RepID=A0A7X6HB82_9MICC|nr:glutamyl-tRNA reductase [Arthrobacter mobilis]NKX53776.1 glutamyl-tRNA reductase [Arthrobacter mobilis]